MSTITKYTTNNIKTETYYSDKYNVNEEQDPEAWSYYISQRSQQWDPDEIVLSEEKNDFNKLNKRYQELVEDLVSFFAPGDGLVCEQIDHLKAEETSFATRAFLGEQFSVEVVHARAYKDVIMTFFDKKKQIEIFKSVDTLPCVKEKADFIHDYMNNKSLPLSLRYVAAAVSEGVFFVSLFAIIFYLRDKRILKRFCFLNEQVSKDEKLHRDFDIMMAARGYAKNQFTYEQAKEIVIKGIEIEKQHVRYILRKPIDSLETDRAGEMTVENMDRYISTLADHIMVGIGLKRSFTRSKDSYLIPNTLLEYDPSWMKGISMGRKTNFYEDKVGNYVMIQPTKNENEKELDLENIVDDI